MLQVSFISAPGHVAAAAGLVTPLRPCPDESVTTTWSTSRLSAVSGRGRPLMRGLPRPNCHSSGLTSYSLLLLRTSAAAATAVPNWNALPLRCRNVYDMVGVALPFRNKGKTQKEWHPAQHQIPGADDGPTYRIRVGDGLYSSGLVVA